MTNNIHHTSLKNDSVREEIKWQSITKSGIEAQNHRLERYIPQLIEDQALAMPEGLALVEGEQTLNYEDLNRRANQLANYLHTHGVQRGTPVGLCIERSIDMVVGLLGILKAGGTYLPMEPSNPAERLNFMLLDAQIPVLITQQHLMERFTLQGTETICLDTDARSLARQSTSTPAVEIRASDLAYIIYTSGSTGQPKGVQISHGSVLNLIHWHQRAFDVTNSDRATQVASPAFDATGWELWPYLTSGASVHIVDEDTRIVPTLLRDWLIQHAITIAFLPTPLAERVLDLEWSSTTSLRFLLAGGDTLHQYPAATLPFALVNNYGPTEATVVATSTIIQATKRPGKAPSIGYPIDNTQIYILDDQLQPVSSNNVGEIYIGGAGLASGYLNRPELTAEKFIAHPFSTDPQARLYKTGDLARYTPDGQIDFIGRVDRQIKLRGFRIELGEIENVLSHHAAIRQAAVSINEDTSGEKHLIAHLVFDKQVLPSLAELQDFLRTQLPDYMHPATFVILDTLPLTSNGKRDLAALPAPDETNTLRDNILVLPETATEKRLTEIIAPLLGLEQVGIDDNFFMLGGHSLLGTQLIVKIVTVFGVDLSLRTLFNAPTIRELAFEIVQLFTAKIETMSEDDVQQLLQFETAS
jgi:amino acid adenylation domain-containing protein